jgi:diguanylate cyclase (GGDEF)-like protein
MHVTAVRLWLVVSAALTTTYFLCSGSVQTIAFQMFSVVTACALLSGRRRSKLSMPWMFLAAAQLAWVTSFVLATLGARVWHSDNLFASNVAYLAGYPLIGLGLFGLQRRRSPRHDRTGMIDASIIAIGITVVIWVYVLSPYTTVEGYSVVDRITALAFPIGDIMLLAAAARLLVSRGVRSISFLCLLGFVFATVGGDCLNLFLSLRGTYQPGGWTDSFWVAGYVLLGLAAVHPSAPLVETKAQIVDARITWPRLVALTIASLLAPGVLIVQHVRHAATELSVVATSTVGLFVLVVARMWQVTKALERSREQSLHDSLHDSLTGLANRSLFHQTIKKNLERAPGINPRVALLYVDLDDFKSINDTLGHDAGDTVLRAVGKRLASSVRGTDLVARLGGDEFAVVLIEPDPRALPAVADRLLRALHQPVLLGEERRFVTASVGMIMDDLRSNDAEHLLRRADRAMYDAKRGGKGKVVFHGEDGLTFEPTFESAVPGLGSPESLTASTAVDPDLVGT